MANSFGTETPPAPDQGANALASSSLTDAPRPMPAVAAQPQQGQPQTPQMSHEQVVAALRHFDAIKAEIGTILKDPALGKSSVKSKIIDGVTRLVAERFLSPAQSVEQLSKVPVEPLQQMKWAKQMMAQAQQAENAVLDHYGMSNPHLGAVDDHFAASNAGNRDHHMDHMSALIGMFGPKKNG